MLRRTDYYDSFKFRFIGKDVLWAALKQKTDDRKHLKVQSRFLASILILIFCNSFHLKEIYTESYLVHVWWSSALLDWKGFSFSQINENNDLQTFIKPNFSFFSQINGNNDRKLMLLLTIIKPFQQLERTFKEIRSDKKVFVRPW